VQKVVDFYMFWKYNGIKKVYVLVQTGAAYTITVPSDANGYYQYRPQGETEWRDVKNGKISLLKGWTVEIRGVPNSGYVFTWDGFVPDESITYLSVNGSVIRFTPTADVTVSGKFSPASTSKKVFADDSGIDFGTISLGAAILALCLVLAAGYAVGRRP